ncbi:MAG: hypothetical protein M3323_12130 [Actinomycetota bacterium]|nr:hypothetical protein [Actinomycetota bacterium]
MILAFRIVVGLGLAGVVALALGSGVDATGVVLALTVVCVGALALSVAHRIKGGNVEPGRCDSCGGLVARSAPYCKHCGARRDAVL